MTLSTALRAGLGRWPWLVGPVVVTAGLAALIGAAVEGDVTYRVTRMLEVTEGAPAEAIFVCRSRDVLAAAMQKADMRPLVPPEELAAQVTVEHAGGRLVRLTVEHGSKKEAGDVAAAIAGEASRRVEVKRVTASKSRQEKTERLETNLRHRRLDRKGALDELEDLKREHPEEIDERGRPLGTAQRRLIAVQDSLAEARRELAAADAEIETLRARVETTPAFVNPAVSRKRGRIRALDRAIARARADVTDEHPHLARLLSERAGIEADSALEGALVPNPLRAELESTLTGAEVRRSRAAAKVGRLEVEEEQLKPLFDESVTLESKVRKINEDLSKAEADVEEMKRDLDRARREAVADARTRAALVDLTGSGGRRAQVVALRAEAPPGRLALLGAGLGLMLGVLLAALAEAMDPVVRTPDDVARVLDVPLLAAIPGVSLGVGGARRRSTRTLGWVVWLVAFLLAAAVLVALVYPGWHRLAAILSRTGRGDAREAPHQIEEVLP